MGRPAGYWTEAEPPIGRFAMGYRISVMGHFAMTLTIMSKLP